MPVSRLPVACLLTLLVAFGCGGGESAADAEAGPEAGGLAPGRYLGTLDLPGGALPFVLEVEADRSAAALVDDHERIACRVVAVDEADAVSVVFDVDSKLELRRGDGPEWVGHWRLRRSAERSTEIACRLVPGDAPRFPAFDVAVAAADAGTAAGLESRWRVDFSASDDPAVALLSADAAGRARGTFLTTVGDYRFLEGTWDGRQLEIACFDGAHAFLFRAERNDDGGLTGDFWSRDSWHETFVAVPDAEARLADGFSLTEFRADPAFGDLAFSDLQGETVRLDAEQFAGKARVLIVFGSWCPNCRDATRLWGELERRHRARGLKVQGLAFERTDDLDHERAKLRDYVAGQRVEFPVLIAGLADKQRASEALPLLDRVRAFPTTVFLRGDGTALAVHTGFTGPAAPEEHARLLERFDALIEELLR